MKNLFFLLRLLAIFAAVFVTCPPPSSYANVPELTSDSGGSCLYERDKETVGVPAGLINVRESAGTGVERLVVRADAVYTPDCADADAVCKSVYKDLELLYKGRMAGIFISGNLLGHVGTSRRRCLGDNRHDIGHRSEVCILLPCGEGKERDNYVWPLLLASAGGRASLLAGHASVTVGKEVRHV